MKVTVRNLGIIKDEATIDLKPLTIFIGPNNSGKTWLAYALAGIFGSYGSNEYADAYAEGRVPVVYKELNAAIEKVLNEGSATIDLDHFAEDYGDRYFNEVAKYARVWMSEYLNTQHTHFDGMDISLQLSENKKLFLERISQFQGRVSIARGKARIQKAKGNSKVFAYTVVEGQNTDEQEEKLAEEIPLEEIKENLINFVSNALHRSLYNRTRVFPTERTALVATRFSGRESSSEKIPDEEQLQKVVKLTETLSEIFKELDISSLPTFGIASSRANQPVSAFLSMLNTLFRVGVAREDSRRKNAESEPKVKRYIELAGILEKQVLMGGVQFSTLEPDPGREILFQPIQDVSLEIPIASSMVKELTPLVFYLRYLAQPGDLVVIDEPEMNLHPEAQAKIIEFLAMLVNAGLNILITTHSPYITDHLTNLIKASECEDKERIRQEFFLQRTEAFIDKEKVSVYGFSDGKVNNVLDEDGIVSWNTFGNITEKIANIFMKL